MKIKRKQLLTVLIAACFVYIGCRKADGETISPEAKSREENFFQSHRSASTNEAGLISYFKRLNDQEHFVTVTIERIGYPYCNKMT